MNDGEDPTQAKLEAMTESLGLQRLKNWKELAPEEKIERMRQEMKRLAQRVGEFSNLLSQLTEHQHSVDGKPTIRLAPGYGYAGMMMPEPSPNHNDDVYF